MRRPFAPAFLALSLLAACHAPVPEAKTEAKTEVVDKPETPASTEAPAVGEDGGKPAAPSADPATPLAAGEVAAKPEAPALAEEAESEPLKPAVAVPGGKAYEVLDEGTGDKALLRFAPKAGQVERMQLTMTMEISIDFGAAMPPQTQKTPPLKMVNKAETLEVADGKITERVTFERFEIDDAAAGTNAMMVTAMKSAMEQMQGFEQKLIYDDRGGVLDGELTIPADANAQVAQSLQNIGNTLEQVMIRFPEQAVGVGAKWRETTELDNNGVRIKQISEYTLESREGNEISLATTVEQQPLSKEFSAPGMPPGVNLDLVDFDSKGGGKIVYTLGNMLPDSGSSHMDTKVTVAADANGQKQEFSTRIKLSLELSRVEE